MRRLPITLFVLTGLAVPGLLALCVDATAAPPIRTADSRLTQLDPVPSPVLAVPSAPVPPVPSAPIPGNGPDPGLSPTPMGGITPIPVAPMPNSSPVPSPDPTGPVYSRPWGTMRDTTPPPKQYLGDPNGAGSYHSPTEAPTPSGQPIPPLETHAPSGITDRFGIAPPPGTLGRTYYRRTSLIDEKKHPRVGIVQVHLSENYDISAKGLKSKWTGKVWELESDPLLPGLPNIIEVVAEWGPEGARQREVRTIRLIMGRIVDVEF